MEILLEPAGLPEHGTVDRSGRPRRHAGSRRGRRLDEATQRPDLAGAGGRRRRAEARPYRSTCSCRPGSPSTVSLLLPLGRPRGIGAARAARRPAVHWRRSCGRSRCARPHCCVVRRAGPRPAAGRGGGGPGARRGSCAPTASRRYRAGDGKDEDERGPERLRVAVAGRRPGRWQRRGSLAAAVCRARDLVSEPGNVLTPQGVRRRLRRARARSASRSRSSIATIWPAWA